MTGVQTCALPISIQRFTYGPQYLVIRTQGDFAPLGSALRQAIRRVDPTVPVFQMRTMDEVRNASLQQERTLLALLGGFSGAALLLAMLGTYGVASFTVQQRTREIGIRFAIGAQASDVWQSLLGKVLRLAVLGAALGLACAFAATRLLSSLLYGTPTTDVLSFVFATLILVLVALVACLIPARRATRIYPMIALRSE